MCKYLRLYCRFKENRFLGGTELSLDIAPLVSQRRSTSWSMSPPWNLHKTLLMLKVDTPPARMMSLPVGSTS